MTYQGIVFISNEIRCILATTRRVSLAAQNASLAARRAGNARGFQAVSAELKKFSQGLAMAMTEISSIIHTIAQSVSDFYRQQRSFNRLKATTRLTGDCSALQQAEKSTLGRYCRTSTVLAERVHLLVSGIAHSLRICSNGRALARSAKIEASSGGDCENMLRGVAGNIERTIEEMYTHLKFIKLRLQAEQEKV